MPSITLKLNKSKKQNGFTLVEVMVSSIIGLITLAGVITFFTNTVQSNSDGLKEVRLNQELRALMDVMVRDIRRAGYWRNANGIDTNIYTTNDYAIKIENSSCITYAYDNDQARNSDANRVQNTDAAGFRLIDNTLKIRRRTALCDSNRNWESISDNSSLNITKLEFSLNNICNNVSSPLQPINSRRGCLAEGGPGLLLAPNPDDALSNMNVVTIVLSGELVSDSSVASIDLVENIAIRNTVNLIVQ